MAYSSFIETQIQEIRATVGDGYAINALSGGVDSAVVTALGHKAIGKQLKTFYVDSGLMRQGEAEFVINTFADLGIKVELVDARQDFLGALVGLTDPEEKRRVISDTFYKKIFSRLVRDSGARHLFHGTILTDIEETVAGIKRQHNILSQLGIDPTKEFGYQVVEPLCTLRKDDVRAVASLLGLPRSISHRIPFPGPGLATRIIGEITEDRLATIRAATAIIEEELADQEESFQYLAVLFNDRATGIRSGKREFGQIIGVRCVNSHDGREATATQVPWPTLERISERITALPDVCRCLYDLTPKPPATVEYI